MGPEEEAIGSRSIRVGSSDFEWQRKAEREKYLFPGRFP